MPLFRPKASPELKIFSVATNELYFQLLKSKKENKCIYTGQIQDSLVTANSSFRQIAVSEANQNQVQGLSQRNKRQEQTEFRKDGVRGF